MQKTACTFTVEGHLGCMQKLFKATHIQKYCILVQTQHSTGGSTARPESSRVLGKCDTPSIPQHTPYRIEENSSVGTEMELMAFQSAWILLNPCQICQSFSAWARQMKIQALQGSVVLTFPPRVCGACTCSPQSMCCHDNWQDLSSLLPCLQLP